MAEIRLPLTALLAGLALAGCEQAATPPAPDAALQSSPQAEPAASTAASEFTRLPELFDCVREEGGLLVAAHRGGPAPGYPENAVETLAHAWQNGAPVMEIDVAESRDGVLFLMHDRTLDRTTTGAGEVADADWAEIKALQLVDDEGTETAFSVPRLSDTLDWAVETGAILELDRKPTTDFPAIIEAVREAGAEDHVILITYNDEQAIEVARLAPELMMTASIGGKAHERDMIEAGIDPDRLVVWGGTSEPNFAKWAALNAKGIESAFGTLGRPGERLDDAYWADGDPEEYKRLVENGLSMLATDEPYRVVRALTAVDIARKECGYIPD